MAKRQAPKRLFRSNDFVSPYEEGASPRKQMNRMTSAHPDVLQNIEWAVVTAHGENDSIDDAAVAEALRCAIKRKEPSEETAWLVNSRVSLVRQTRPEIPESVWQEGLQVVLASVKRHSKLHPGETSYLDFVRQYVA